MGMKPRPKKKAICFAVADNVDVAVARHKKDLGQGCPMWGNGYSGDEFFCKSGFRTLTGFDAKRGQRYRITVEEVAS